MPITSTTSCKFHTYQRLIVDCAAVRFSDEARADVRRIVDWLKSHPHNGVHVVLQSATGSIVGRQLKSVFQSLGCTVSMITRF